MMVSSRLGRRRWSARACVESPRGLVTFVRFDTPLVKRPQLGLPRAALLKPLGRCSTPQCELESHVLLGLILNRNLKCIVP